ncbi:hypothetical protein UP10_41825 [Bradyrhizobium sp. LTSPM299]|uniref:glycosyltransferase family 2 protein n=1 Tax=Bradyrhizobium sp. LTSPM299 TaxID=1619233 RepID=UPI0005CB31D0|nr:glycosyltransferase family 2 protein [Bradyrhizobium sp. LTSPM299]KJC53638.1 hypothetical protein UP10_41825 [Bradyrhizobium sp. LTSPM299]
MTTSVSVITPTFRRPLVLREMLESVLCENEIDLEVIVVDDSPERAAESVVSSFGDPRIRYEVNPQPSGGRPSLVRNVGIPLAKGRYVHFLDDDDKAPVGHYAAMVKAFEARPAAGVIFGRVQPFGENAEKLSAEFAFFDSAARRASMAQRLGGRWATSARLSFDRTLLVCGAAMIRRECLTALGGFNPSLRIAEDVEFYARAIRSFGGWFTERVTLQYRIWDASIMHGAGLDDVEVRDSYKRIHSGYLSQHGIIDYVAARILCRTLFRVI